ncbi:laccase-5-like [Homalodisca vitripennis]|uniref:laccase-5-like n=1 Tax=Homalodisca vitripennis TaxID=197043 RepID=UPI001EEC8C50|nr:laccase-5-like [Homalodisca vitripennis]
MVYRIVTILLLLHRGAGDEYDDTTCALLQYLQIDDVDCGLYDTLDNLPANSCTRECVAGEPRVCYYQFTVEEYSAMGQACEDCLTNVTDCYNPGCVTADGFERCLLTTNRRLPGPSIQVCVGDRIIVDLVNMLKGKSTTIHWHGIRQKDYKFMDGVPFVTQCPIHHSETFRYNFIADAAGLHFYHSHEGLQKVDGLVGGLVVRRPRDEDPNGNEYDFDLPSHLIVIQDWHHLSADAMFPGLKYRSDSQMAQTYLINGRGQWLMTDGYRLANTPLSQFNVVQGNRYVFRIVAATCFECQYIFTIEKHDLVVIGADVHSTKPYRVDSLTMSPGERYTVVVNCNRSIDSYWIQVRTVGFCSDMAANQVAVLTYEGASRSPSSKAPSYDVTEVNDPGLTMGPVNSMCTEETRVTDGPCVSHLRSATESSYDIYKSEPDERIIMAYGFYPYDDNLVNLTRAKKFTTFLQTANIALGATINGIINKYPPSPLLSQFCDIPPSMLCSADAPSTWNNVFRECVHIVKVPANKTLEIILLAVGTYDPEGISHPTHLHGYDMHVIEMGVLNQSLSFNQSVVQLFKSLVSEDRNDIPTDTVTKDVVALSAGGYLIARIYTDNPGFWFFHCHFAYHLDAGMSGVLQVGEVDTFPEPPAGFPRCGSFLPPL